MRNKILFALMVYTATLFACNSGGENSGNGNRTNTPDATLTGHPPTCKCDALDMYEFDKTIPEAEFWHRAFKVAFDIGKPINDSQIKLTVPYAAIASLGNIAQDLGGETADCKGVRVHYALNGSGYPAFLFSMDGFKCSTATNTHVTYSIVESKKYYEWDSVQKAWNEVDAEAAREMKVAYRDKVKKQNNPLDIKPDEATSDHLSIIFPYDELVALVKHNLEIVTKALTPMDTAKKLLPIDAAKEITKVNFCWAAYPDAGVVKHVVVMIPTLDGKEYEPVLQALTMKAANLSNGCPPICPGKTVAYKLK